MPMRPHLVPRALTLAAVLLALPSASAHALIPRVSACAPPGWAAPVVPRPAADMSDTLAVPLPGELRGDVPTFINWASCGNPAAGGGWTDALYLDGDLISIAGRPYDPRWVNHYFYSLNGGPVWVRGGRHTLMVHADLYGQMLDGPGDVSDDFASRQYIWPPMATAWGSLQGGPSPPPRLSNAPGGLPNCEAWALARPAIWPWCVSVSGPAAPGLILYDDYAGPTSGLSHAIAAAYPNGDSTDFVVGQGEGTASTVYAAVTRGAGDLAGAYTLYSNDASAGRTGGSDGQWQVDLPAGGVAQVFRLSLTAGQACPISLMTIESASDLAFAVFPAGSGGVFTRAGALAGSAPQSDPRYDALVFTPPVSGDYPLVVYRATSAGVTQLQGYVLGVGSYAAAVPGAGESRFALTVSPNPVRDAARVDYALPAESRATLAVHDLQGRRLRTLVDGVVAAGPHAADWDGRDQAGSRVAPGLYWLRLTTGGRTLTRAVVVAR